jgi:hypothetical protein
MAPGGWRWGKAGKANGPAALAAGMRESRPWAAAPGDARRSHGAFASHRWRIGPRSASPGTASDSPMGRGPCAKDSRSLCHWPEGSSPVPEGSVASPRRASRQSLKGQSVVPAGSFAIPGRSFALPASVVRPPLRLDATRSLRPRATRAWLVHPLRRPTSRFGDSQGDGEILDKLSSPGAPLGRAPAQAVGIVLGAGTRRALQRALTKETHIMIQTTTRRELHAPPSPNLKADLLRPEAYGALRPKRVCLAETHINSRSAPSPSSLRSTSRQRRTRTSSGRTSPGSRRRTSRSR